MTATRHVGGIWVIACLAILLSAGAAPAFAATQVRFLHALPGAPAGTLEVAVEGAGPAQLGPAAFGRFTAYRSVADGQATLTLSAGRSGRAGMRRELREGARITVVASKAGGRIALRLYDDARSRAGAARVRAVNAAPEVGRAEILLGGRPLGTLRPGSAGEHETVDPGTYELVARAADGAQVIARERSFAVSAGTAGTAYLVGSAGERTRFVFAPESTAAPAAGPETGLGGLSDDGPPWLAAALAAAAAALLGGGLYLRAAGRRGRGA